jgi:hypothetical protein
VLDIPADAAVRASDAISVAEGQRESGRVVRNAAVSMIVAMLILFMFNSDGLRTYARDLPESDLADRIVLMTDRWHDLMSMVGLAEPKAFVRELMRHRRAD